MKVNTHNVFMCLPPSFSSSSLPSHCVSRGVWRAEENPLFWKLICGAACPYAYTSQTPRDTVKLA